MVTGMNPLATGGLAVTLRATAADQDSSPGVVNGAIEDVGAEGIRLGTQEPLARGWRLVLRVAVPPLGTCTEVTTAVAWCRPDGSHRSRRYICGLSFEPLGQFSVAILLNAFAARWSAPPLPFAVPPAARPDLAPPIA